MRRASWPRSAAVGDRRPRFLRSARAPDPSPWSDARWALGRYIVPDDLAPDDPRVIGDRRTTGRTHRRPAAALPDREATGPGHGREPADEPGGSGPAQEHAYEGQQQQQCDDVGREARDDQQD